jgi:hypothetical protein
VRRASAGVVERNAGPDWVRRGVEESLKALGTDYALITQGVMKVAIVPRPVASSQTK